MYCHKLQLSLIKNTFANVCVPWLIDRVPFSSDFLLSKQIKTFTYEIPDDTKVPTNQNFAYKNEYYNESNSSRTYYPERDVPPPIKTTTSYSNESHNNTVNRVTGPSVPMNPDNLGPNQTYFYKKEVNETTNNVSIVRVLKVAG